MKDENHYKQSEDYSEKIKIVPLSIGVTLFFWLSKEDFLLISIREKWQKNWAI